MGGFRRSDLIHQNTLRDHATNQREDFWNTVLVKDCAQLVTSTNVSPGERILSTTSSTERGKSLLLESSKPRVSGSDTVRTDTDADFQVDRVRKETVCHICRSSFKRKYDLLQHISAVHDKKRPYKCNNCDSSFAHKGTLSKHVRTVHRRERPYMCEYCGLRFSEKGNVNKHKQRAESCRLRERRVHFPEHYVSKQRAGDGT